MGIYGYDRNTTPNIDKWAKNATVFTNMRTIIPSTYPSFAMLMTGISPTTSRIFDNAEFYGKISPNMIPISNKYPTLAELLKKQGYKTGAFLNTAALDGKLTHLDRGFDVYLNSDKMEMTGPQPNEKYKSYANMQEALKWIKLNKNNKFFAWIHLMEAHAPYFPIPQFACSNNKEYCDEIKSRSLGNLETERKSLQECQVNGLPQTKIDLFKTLYDGGISTADELIGTIFEFIGKENLNKSTLVIIYGDHGEGFDHNFYFAHTHELYDSSLKIPLLIKNPNKHGEINSENLQNTQILPYISSLLKIGLESANYTKSQKVEFYINSDLSKYAIHSNNYKYVYSVRGTSCLFNDQTDELYNLHDDPDEKTNLISTDYKHYTSLKKILMSYISTYKLPVTLTTKQFQKTNADINTDAEKLKRLGY